MQALNVLAILVAGLMVGCELSIAVFVHPVFNQLSDDAHIKVSSRLAHVLGTYMPFWYMLVFLLSVTNFLIRWQTDGRIATFVAASASLWLTAILYSIVALVPINKRIESWIAVTPPADWKNYRNKWDELHRWRVVLLTTALIFLVVGIVSK